MNRYSPAKVAFRNNQILWVVAPMLGIGGVSSIAFLTGLRRPPAVWILAVGMGGVSLYALIRYAVRHEPRLPTVALFAAMHALMFGVPALTNDLTMLERASGPVTLTTSQVQYALILCIAAMTAFQGSYFSFRSRNWMRNVPALDLQIRGTCGLAYCGLLGLLGISARDFEALLPPGWQLRIQAFTWLLEMQTLIVVALLSALAWQGRRNPVASVTVAVLVIFLTVRGLADLFLERALVPLIVLFGARWTYTARLPWKIGLLVAIVFFLLSPVKAEVRESAGGPGMLSRFSNPDSFRRVALWIPAAHNYWGGIPRQNPEILKINQVGLSRLDLIHQLGYITANTPTPIPYQKGETYRYLLVAPVPRVLWPEKPQVGEANRYYALRYGITDEEHSRTTTFGMSLIGEGYINFGPLGVIGLMVALALFFAVAEQMLTSRSGAGGHAAWLAFAIPFTSGIGYSAEVFLGNAIQLLVCNVLLLFLIHRLATRSESLGEVQMD